jgi:hypothetical protein
MANQTVTTNTNYDSASISGLTNGDTINLNGGTLTINSDMRWGQQAAVVGHIIQSATATNALVVDGRDVWWMPYDGGTGNVPALGTVGTNDVTGSTAGAGEFLGVFTALGVAPTAAASAMPATGFIKFRKVTAAFVDNEVMTFAGGATATVNSTTGGQRGWINFVGAETFAMTVTRLGSSTWYGEWFELGTTNGTDDQTFQYYVADAVPAIWVETSSGSGVYEPWVCAGNRWGTTYQHVSQDARGKMFGCDSTTGVITIAKRAANACGYKPSSGCKVRVPNIHMSSANSGAYGTNTRHATLTSRYEFSTTGGGALVMDKVSCNAYLNCTGAYTFTITNSGFLDAVAMSNPGSYITFNNVAVGCSENTTDYLPVSFSAIYFGGEITGGHWLRRNGASGSVSFSMSDSISSTTRIVFTDTKAVLLGVDASSYKTGSTFAYNLPRNKGVDFIRPVAIMGRFDVSSCEDITFTDIKFANAAVGNTLTTVADWALGATTTSKNISVDGLAPFESLSNVMPYGELFDFTTSCSYIEFKNIGTYASPLDLGGLTGYGPYLNGVNNIKLRRIYLTNTRTQPWTTFNTTSLVDIKNFHVDYADTVALNTISSSYKGIKYTPTTGGVNAVYGTHFVDSFLSSTTGSIVIYMNESTPASVDQVTVVSGTPTFTSGGQILMATLGDQVIWTMPYFAIGHTAFRNVAPTLTGTNTGNMTYEYQIDTGTGWNGTWKTLNGTNLSGETVPGYTDFYNRGGAKLKVRVTTATAAATNLITSISIPTVSTSTAQGWQYPLEEKTFGYSGTVSGTNLSITDASTKVLAAPQVTHSGSSTVTTVPWDSDYSALFRLRKAGYEPVEETVTIDNTGLTTAITPNDWSTIPSTDPGALGITVTNHGATPTSWNSKDFSITIKTTNDSLTASDVANYINYNVSQTATWNSFSGMFWPHMVEPDGTDFKTVYGELLGSAGATLKGVRVVRNDGTTAVPGFSMMQADDGTYWTSPVTYGVAVTGLESGSQVQIFTTGTQTLLASTSSSGTSYTWSDTGTAPTVDVTIIKEGFFPIRTTGLALASGSTTPLSVSMVIDRAYVASSGLSFGTTATVNTGTKKFAVTTATTVQNWYSFMIESWKNETTLRNVAFPVLTNGPGSFTLSDDWEWFSGASIAYLSGDGMRYVNSSDAQTAVWAAIMSVGAPTGYTVRYKQSDSGTMVSAGNTGNINELAQVYGDATHGNFDYRGYFVAKIQGEGYDEVVSDAVATYGTLEDQLYVLGLSPVANGIATGNPSLTGITITDHGASPVTWNGKQYSITITDSSTPSSGTNIMRWLRYNFGQGGTFQSKNTFDWHDLVQTNGSNFKTVRGVVYGDTGATLKGVRVVMNDGTSAHPDFDLMTADDGTTYVPPVILYQSVTISGAVAGSRIQIYDTTSSTELYNGTPTFPYTWTDSVAASANRAIRLRVAYNSGVTAKNFLEAAIGTCGTTTGSEAVSYLVSQTDDAVYIANGINGSTITDITIDDSGLLCEVDSGAVTWGYLYAYESYWLSTSAGIVDEGKFIVAVDQANYRFTDFKIKNVSSPSVPLVISGGYAVDNTTGLIEDIIDTSGGNIFPVPDHVVAFASGSGVTAGDINAIAAAVWEEPVADHTTTDTMGEITGGNLPLIPAAL